MADRRVVILGGGSAGLTTACELVKGGVPVDVVEIKPQIGGLALTFEHDGFKLDYGPHAFHAKNDDADDVFKEFCGQNYREFPMKASLLLHGEYFDYPLKFGQAVLRLNPLFTLRMGVDYLVALFKRFLNEVPEDSFEAWGVKRYGRTMYDMAFGHYSRKVWGMPTAQLSHKMAEQKLPDLSFWELILEALGGPGAKQKMLYSSYLYPNGGMGVVFDNMEKFIVASGSRVHKCVRGSEIYLDDGRVRAVRIFGNSGDFVVECSHLVSTIPIPHTVNALRPTPPAGVLAHANRLIYRNLILIMLVVDMPNVTNEIMVYLLDKHFTSNRIGEQKNIDDSMIPMDKTVLTFELCTDDRSKVWHAPDEALFEIAKRDLMYLGTVPESKISGFFVKRLEQVYPIYDLDFDVHLSAAVDYLLSIPNLVPLGRQGLFIHNDIHDSMKMGLEGAWHILSDRPPEAWGKKARDFLNWRLS